MNMPWMEESHVVILHNIQQFPLCERKMTMAMQLTLAVQKEETKMKHLVCILEGIMKWEKENWWVDYNVHV